MNLCKMRRSYAAIYSTEMSFFSVFYAELVLISDSDSEDNNNNNNNNNNNAGSVPEPGTREELEQDRADIVEEYQSMFTFKKSHIFKKSFKTGVVLKFTSHKKIKYIFSIQSYSNLCFLLIIIIIIIIILQQD
jgi:hypothetical protein